MDFGVKPSSTSPQPGFYKENIRVDWEYFGDVFRVGLTFNSTQVYARKPVINDSESVRRTFSSIYVDQALGNVLFDSSFSKLLNQQVASTNPQTFADLPGPLKYMYNGLMFTANYNKVASGNRKFLILGDTTSGDYWIKDTVNFNAFGKSLACLAAAGNWQFTYKDSSDYSGGKIDVTESELDNFVGVLLVSSNDNGQINITSNAVTNLQKFRNKGNGIFVITSTGATVNNLVAAQTAQPSSYFNTANQVAIAFGTWFSGNINRTKAVTVLNAKDFGFIPLYNNMADTDVINPISSGSSILMNEFDPLVTKESLSGANFNSGLSKANFIVLNSIGNTAAYTYTYVINPNSDGIIQFKDLTGNLITQLNIGKTNTAIVDIKLDGGTMFPNLSGFIYKNNLKIGEFKYDNSSEGSVTNLYAGNGTPIPLSNNDVIRGVITVPFDFESQLPVVRNQPSINGIYTYAGVIKAITPFVGSSVLPKNQVLSGYKLVDTLMPHLQLGAPFKTPALNIKYIKNYLNNNLNYPERYVNIYETTTEFNNALATYTPPPFSTVFSNWPRFDGDNYYIPPVTPPAGSNATGWIYNAPAQRIVQTITTDNFNGVVCKEIYDCFDLDVVVQSSDTVADNAVCVIAAARFDGNLMHTLSVVINRGLSGDGNSDANIMLVLNYKTPRQVIIAKNLLNNEFTPWNNAYKRVHISRRSSVYTFQFSKWNSLVLDSTLTMTLDMRVNPSQFSNLISYKTSYGFGSFKQKDSRFYNMVFGGVLDNKVLLNYQTNEAYYWSGTVWNKLTGMTIADVFGAPRVLVPSIEGVAAYYINKDGTIIK